MTSAESLAGQIRGLRLPDLADTTVAVHAVVQTLDPHTLAIVVFYGHHTQLIEQAIQDRHPDLSITTANDVITIRV